MKTEHTQSILVKAFNELRYNKIVKNQSDFAEKLGYNRSYISNLLSGNKETNDTVIEQLFSVFPDVAQLLEGKKKRGEDVHNITEHSKQKNSISLSAVNDKLLHSHTSQSLDNKKVIKGLVYQSEKGNSDNTVILALMSSDALYSICDNSLAPRFPKGTQFALKLKDDGILHDGNLYALQTSSDIYIGHIFDDGDNYVCVRTNKHTVYPEGHIRAGKLRYNDIVIPKNKVDYYFNVGACATELNGHLTPPNKRVA